jgi:hypothetical protein
LAVANVAYQQIESTTSNVSGGSQNSKAFVFIITANESIIIQVLLHNLSSHLFHHCYLSSKLELLIEETMSSSSRSNRGKSPSRKSRKWMLGCSIIGVGVLAQFFQFMNVSSTTTAVLTNKFGPGSVKDFYGARRGVTNKSGSKEKSAPGHASPESTAVRSNNMPSWLVEYSRWHTEQRSSLTINNWKDKQYLIVYCFEDRHCGGASDRLQYVPMAMRVASQYNRILLIHWERPYPLQEYLVPPTDGIDWRVPEYMLETSVCAKAPVIMSGKKILSTLKNNGKLSVVCMQYQIWDHGSLLYNEIAEEKKEPGFNDVFRDIWNLMFQPSPPVQNMLVEKLKSLDLQPAAYVAAHVRALYKNDASDKNQLVENALRCASSLKPNSSDTPIFMTSDSDKVLKHAVAYGKANNRTVVARTEDPAPLHLDRGGVFLENNQDWKNHTVADYYDVFVDLYLLASAECLSIHIGGYGNWGRLLSYNPACYIRHDRSKNCAWGGQGASPKKEKKEKPVEIGAAPNNNKAIVAENKNMGHGTPSFPHVAVRAPENKSPESAAVRTNSMPSWLVEYSRWHTEQRAALTVNNWKNNKYLIMHCSQDMPCGGASDRLQYIPMAMRFASRYNRILLIHWERPFPLQEYLVPPTGGIDWRVPEYMLETPICAQAPLITSGKRIHSKFNNTREVVCMRYQIWDHGSLLYNEIAEEKDEPGFNDVYRGLWNLVFQPSPPVQNLLVEKLKSLDLQPAAYVAVHVRALYKNDASDKNQLVENAVRCASGLKPNSSDTPIFMASDSDKVLRHAVAYGKANNRTVVARTEDPAPLHLDRGGVFLENSQAWNNHTTADYYDVFVDLYLLASAECTSFHIGGYGKWGRLLSYNPACYIRHDHSKNCAWGG